MIAARQWPADKPLPDPKSFLARNLLDSTLKEMGYVPAKLGADKVELEVSHISSVSRGRGKDASTGENTGPS